MSTIIDELLESFRSSSEKLEELSEGLDELQSAQKLVETLSQNLGEAAKSLQQNAISHNEFISSAKTTNNQLGEVIKVLKDLDTKSINTSLSRIVKSLDENKTNLTDLATSLTEAERRAEDLNSKLDQVFGKLDTLLSSNASLSKQLKDSQSSVEERFNGLTEAASGRHKSIVFLLLLIAAAAAILVANLAGFLSI